MAMLADTPSLGRDRSDVAPGYRNFPEGRRVVFYMEVEAGDAIIAVPHASMDVQTHFG